MTEEAAGVGLGGAGEPVQAAGGVVFRYSVRGPEILVIDDRYGRVSLPKGHREEGELLEETALREIEEETGIQGRIVSPIRKVSYEYSDDRGRAGLKHTYFFLVERTGGELRPQREEVFGARFASLEETLSEIGARSYLNLYDVFLRASAMLSEMGDGTPLLADRIDHTLLSPEAGRKDVARLCREAAAYQFASVCVNPAHVLQCAELLGGTPVKVCSVVGFPFGATLTEAKVCEAVGALRAGAEELDMVANLGALLEGDLDAVERDIRAVVEAVGDRGAVKVILETAVLTPEQIAAGAQRALAAGAQYVKTSTGYSRGGATESAVRALRAAVGDRMGVKASGGIRTPEAAAAMISAGASRIGTSGGPRLVVSPHAEPWD